jgi:amino acid adenylation domain-containing protein
MALSVTALYEFLDASARRHPQRVAVREPGVAAITYAELAALSDAVRDRLVRMGVAPGDRVGIYVHKSIDSLAAVFGILKTGAAYVPVDPTAPAARNAYIHTNCSVKAVVIERQFGENYRREVAALGGTVNPLLLDGAGGGAPLRAALDREQGVSPAPAVSSAKVSPRELGYILYTSGSTGKPKGVMLTHENGISYVDWCSEVFQPDENAVFSSHAPFHFDLSILDIYVPLKHGATLILIGEELGKDPAKLAQVISDERITNWYSTPSILTLLMQYGKLDKHDFRALRMVLYAGEPFPIKHLRALKALWPHPRYFNLYGPTETNVCTYLELPDDIPGDMTKPFPIGKTCSHLRSRVVDEAGRDVPRGSEGELIIAGPGITQGYWKLPENTARAFFADAAGVPWYRTGDVVVEMPDGNFDFLGRRDRMVKRRGYRIELGEIESALSRHPSIKEAAAVSLPDADGGVLIQAFLACHEGKRPSIIELKRFCTENLPQYMIPDRFSFQESLPKTSTDKMDYQRLKDLA